MKTSILKRLLSMALCLCMVLSCFPAVSFAAEGEDDGYALNESAFTQLPMGAVEANGWLLQQLYYQKNGLTTYIQDNWAIYGPNNAWRGGTGDYWEKGPYYLRGLVSLAWTLDDQELKDQAMEWLDFILESQVETGYFGPTRWGDGTGTNWDWWPHMVVIQTLRDYYEATELEGNPDERVMPLFENYFKFQLEQLPNHKLSSWGASRGGDNLEVVLWYYGRTYDPANPEANEWLIDLGELIISQTISQTSGRDWTDIFTNTTVREHVVNTTQAMKTPAVIWQMTGAEEDRQALRQALRNMGIDHGRVDNLANSDEAARENYPYRGSETCSVVESLLSNEIAIRILGEGWIGDEIESLAYNNLPVCYTADFRAHVYYQAQNQVVGTEGWHEFDCDHHDDIAYGAYTGYECCFPNMHMGWPKFVQSMWMGTNDGGLAVVAYGPNTVTTTVAGGKTAVFTEETDYPFKDTIGLTYSGETASFPLMLRVPEWCDSPSFTVNGETVTGEIVNGYITIDREWKEGDVVTVKLPMEVKLSYWYNDSVAVKYGVLTFALNVDEEWYEIAQSNAGFVHTETRAASAWNYGLVIDPDDIASSFTVEVADEVGLQPFIQGNAPITIKVTGQLIPEWKLKGNVVPEPPYSPIAADESLQEEIELVPYGSTRMHITLIPWIGETPEDLTTTKTMKDADTYVENGVSVVEFDNVNVRSADNYKLVVNYTGSGTLDVEINTKYRETYEFAGEPIVIEDLVNIVPTASPTSTTYFRFGYGKYNNIRFIGESDVEITSIQVVPVNPFTAPEISRASMSADGTMTVSTNIDRADGYWYLEYGTESGVYTHTVENLYSRTATVNGLTGDGPFYVRAYMLANGKKVYTEEVQVSNTISDTTPDFSDDFEDPTVSKNLWYVMDPNGVVTFEDGLMKVGYSSNIKVTTDERSWTDYAVVANLQGVGDPTRDFGIMVRASNFVDGADGYNGYYVGINPAGGGGLIIGYADGGWHQIAKVGGFTYDAAKTYELKVIVTGERLVAYVDGVKLFDKTFTEMGTPNYASGGAGLRSWNQGFTVDEFQVREISDEEYEALGIDPDAPVETPVDPTVPSFSDDFSNAEASAEKWTEYGNTDSINITDGKLAFTANSDVKAVAGDESWADYVVEGDISLTDTKTGANYNGGLMFRATGVTTGADGFNGYFVGIGNTADGGYVIRGYCNGKWNLGGYTYLDYSFEPNVDYHLKVVAYGEKFAIYLEDELIEVFSSTTYTNGQIGLRGWNKSFAGDNVVVRAVTEEDLVDIKAPVAINEAIGTYETIQVSFPNFGTARRYKIQYGTESGVYTRTVDGLTASGYSYEKLAFSVPENGTYYCRVLAVNGTQIEGMTEEFVVTTNQRQDLSDSEQMKGMTILLESAEAKAVDSDCVQLTWAVEYANSVKNDPYANLHEVSLAKSSLEIGIRVADVDIRENVTAVADVAPITVNMNLTAEQVAAKLPDSVEVTYGKYGQTANARIESWVCENYNNRTPGEYVFSGILAESDSFANGNGLIATATVTVTNVDRYEAELGVITSPAIIRNRDNASNGQLVGVIDNENASVTFTVWADVAGTYDMAITYTGHTSYPNTAHKVIVNGEEMVVSYTEKKGWYDLYTQSVEIGLNAGENTIIFTHAGIENSFAELDCIDLTLLKPVEEVPLIARGYTGDLTWTLDANGKLAFQVLREPGKMKKYTAKNEVPWAAYAEQITSVEIPEGVTRISSYTFYGMGNLTSVAVPATVTEISEYALKNSGLTSVTLPSGLVTIGDSAFYGTAITSVVIPETVETVGEYAFARTALAEVTFTGDAPGIGTGAFNKVVAAVYYPAGNASWNTNVQQNYGGTLTWTAK